MQQTVSRNVWDEIIFMLRKTIKCTAILISILLVTLYVVAIPNMTSAETTSNLTTTQTSQSIQALNNQYLGQFNFSQAVLTQNAITANSNGAVSSDVYTGNLNGTPATVYVSSSFVTTNGDQTGYVYKAVFSGSLNYQVTDSTNKTTVGNTSTILSTAQVSGKIYSASVSEASKITTTDVVTKQVELTYLLNNATGTYSETIQGSATLPLNQTAILSGTISENENLFSPAGQYTVYFGSSAELISASSDTNASNVATGNSNDLSGTKATVVMPDGTVIDPTIAPFGAIHTGWYGLETLTGVIVEFNEAEWQIGSGFIIAVVIGAVSLTLTPIAGFVLGVLTAFFVTEASFYQASDGNFYVYVEMVIVDLVIVVDEEVGMFSNQVLNLNGSHTYFNNWYFIPLAGGAGSHSSIWPPGF